MTNFSDPIRSAINNALHKAQQDGDVFDAYAAAIEICEAFPDAQLAIDDLIDSMISRVGCIPAVEISPPALMIEILIPFDDDDEILKSRLAEEGASSEAVRAASPMQHVMDRKVKRRFEPDKIVHLYTQADRARKMAARCGSGLVADLFEVHAQTCERNAKMAPPRRH